MNTHRIAFYGFTLALFLMGLALCIYQHIVSDIPWTPKDNQRIWSIEAKLDFTASGEPVKLSFSVPNTQPGFELLAERTASPGYGLAFVENDKERLAQWSIRKADGRQSLYYQADFLSQHLAQELNAIPPVVQQYQYTDAQATAADYILQNAIAQSADAYTLARELILEFNKQEQQSQLLVQSAPKEQWLAELLQNAGVAARVVHVLNLNDGRRRQALIPYLQVFSGDNRYTLFNIESAQQGQKNNQLLWEKNSQPIVELIGGEDARLSFAIIKRDIPLTELVKKKIQRDIHFLDFSIHTLPLEEQAVFKGILLVPVGVLIVVILRVLVGIRTSGTFMPVLIAIAFIQTTLITGLIGFVLIVGAGLMIRSFLSRHNLLLVARISAVIISVIFIIALFSILSYQLGLAEGLKITFFPMIILSWTIERMSILWEEEGAKEVFIQVGGSLLVAIIVYSAMSNEFIRHLTFNFMGIQFIFFAFVLLLGSYTGYRLMELKRFSFFKDN